MKVEFNKRKKIEIYGVAGRREEIDLANIHAIEPYSCLDNSYRSVIVLKDQGVRYSRQTAADIANVANGYPSREMLKMWETDIVARRQSVAKTKLKEEIRSYGIEKDKLEKAKDLERDGIEARLTFWSKEIKKNKSLISNSYRLSLAQDFLHIGHSVSKYSPMRLLYNFAGRCLAGKSMSVFRSLENAQQNFLGEKLDIPVLKDEYIAKDLVLEKQHMKAKICLERAFRAKSPSACERAYLDKQIDDYHKENTNPAFFFAPDAAGVFRPRKNVTEFSPRKEAHNSQGQGLHLAHAA